MFCNQCGKEIEEGLQFCPNCGNSVDENGGKTDASGKPVSKTSEANGLIGNLSSGDIGSTIKFASLVIGALALLGSLMMCTVYGVMGVACGVVSALQVLLLYGFGTLIELVQDIRDEIKRR